MVEYITHTYYGNEDHAYDIPVEESGLHKWINDHCKHGWELFQIIPIKSFYSYEKPSWGANINIKFFCVFKKVEVDDEA